MRFVAVAFVVCLAIPAARAEEPTLEAIGEAQIVSPRMNRRHVVASAPEEAKPAVEPEPAPAAPEEPAPEPVKADRKGKAKKDPKADKAAAKKAAEDAKKLSELVPDAPIDRGFEPEAAAAAPVEAEPAIVSPTHSRNVVLTPSPKIDLEEVDAQMPKAALPAVEEKPEVREEAPETPAPPMRNVRIGLGIAVLGAMGANLAMTHLDHADRFLGVNTHRFAFAHEATEIGAFAALGTTGLVEALGPDSQNTAHKVAFVTATVAAAAQAGLLIATEQREGYANQMTISRAHLGVSYAAAAALAVSTIALAF